MDVRLAGGGRVVQQLNDINNEEQKERTEKEKQRAKKSNRQIIAHPLFLFPLLPLFSPLFPHYSSFSIPHHMLTDKLSE